MSVVIYSTPSCSGCRVAKKLLEDNKISVLEYDVSNDESLTPMLIEKYGLVKLPIIETEDTVIIGFDKDKITKLITLLKG